MSLPAEFLDRFPCQPVPIQTKGETALVFDGQRIDGESAAIYVGLWNAVSVFVSLNGVGSANFSASEASAPGAVFLPVIDPNASRVVNGSEVFDFIAGSPWIKVQLSGLTGVFNPGAGFQVVVTPYLSAGPISITAKVP